MLQRYIDIHTHHIPQQEDVLAILNRYENFGQTAATGYCSMGLHPWYLGDTDAQMEQLEQYSTADTVLAIGECGLDKLYPTPFPLQQATFKRQIAWANRLGKPLLIHCVRAYSEALLLLRKAAVPVIFHGFNKKAALAATVLSQGHYLSFGAALLRNNATVAAALAATPADRLFLETDTAAVSIAEVYKATASIRKTGEDELILQLQQNFKTVFGI